MTNQDTPTGDRFSQAAAPGCFGGPVAASNREQQQHEADDRDFGYPAGTQEPKVAAHEDGDGDGQGDGEHAPRALGQRPHHHQRQHSDDDDHDDESADDRRVPADDAELLSGHLAQRTAAPPGGDPQHEVVLHRPPTAPTTIQMLDGR